MENTNLKPAIRFPEFTENWQETKFKNHFEFKNTNSLSRDKLNYESGSVKNIHYGDIHTKFNTHFDIEKEELPFVNEDVDISRIDEENYVLEGDLVMADASEDYVDIGKTIEIINTNNERILAGLHTFLARKTDETLACGFFGHLLTNYNVRLELMRIAQGTKVLGLSKGRVEKITLVIPEPAEQKKIADFLTSIETRITLLKEKKDALLEFKKGVMQKIFNQEIRFKDDNGKDFPDWEEKKLGKVCRLQGGYAFKSNKFKNEGIPIIRISNISNSHNFIDNNNIVYYEKITNDGNFKLKKGDLLVAMSGATTGKSSIYNLEEIGYLNQRVGLFKPTNELNHSFLVQFVFSKLFKNQLTSVLVTGAQPNLSGKEVENFKIPFPQLEEQIKIASYLTVLDDKIEVLQQKIDASVDFKKGLLQKMFV